MNNQKVIGFSIPEKYMVQWEEFSKLVESDENFQKIMRIKTETDRRYKKGRRNSAMIRYAISFFIKETKTKRLKEVIEYEKPKINDTKKTDS